MGQRKTTPANRERILQVAAKLIRERGIANTTLADIAEAAAISKGTLYYYYATKGDLIFDIAERHMRNMTDRIFKWLDAGGGSPNPKTTLRLVFDTVTHSRSRGQMHLYLIQEAITEHPSLRARFVEEYGRLLSIIEEGITRVFGNDPQNQRAAHVLLATIDGVIVQRLLGVKELPLDEVAAFFDAAVRNESPA